MNSLKKTMMAIVVLLSGAVSNAQIKNATTETVKIFGNCGMCETKIEKAGNLKNVAKVDWNEDSKLATLTYDKSKTTQDEILKRIALVGYDSEKFLAPDAAYSKLPGCCKYDREAKTAIKSEDHKMETATAINVAETQEVNPLQPIFDNYFELKDALVKSEGKTASIKAKELLSSIEAVKMETLKMDVHMVWMKVLKDLTADANRISETQDIKKQRDVFKSLSKNTYELIKVSKSTEPVYYQYCPMQDANWLSKENAVKNPYYGAQMMTCGKTVETIK